MKHKIIKKFFGLWLPVLLTGTHPLLAQDSTRHLTLQEVIQLSISNSKQLKADRARVDELVATTRETKESRLPDVKISGSYLRVNNPNIDLKTNSNNNNGGGNGSSSTTEISQALYGIANVSYPIYAGNRYKYAIESANYLEQAARLDADNDRDAVVQNAIAAYVNLYKSKAAVALVRENLEQARKRDIDFANLERNGILARNDLLKVQLQTSNIELSLLDAENNSKLANVNMNLMLGLPGTTEIIADSTSLEAAMNLQGIETYEQAAIQNRKDLQALAIRRKAAGTQIKATKSEYYPVIALTGGYVAARVPGLLTLTNAVNVGIGVQYNLSSIWKTKSKIQQSVSREQQVVAQEEILNDRIRYQVNEAYQNCLLSRKKIDVYAKAIDQAQENYKITSNKYRNSLVTTTDLLDADVAQLQARLNYAFAKADAVAAYNRLLQVAGLLTNNTK